MMAFPSLISSLHPVLCGLVISPGIAYSSRFRFVAQQAVLSAPDLIRA